MSLNSVFGIKTQTTADASDLTLQLVLGEWLFALGAVSLARPGLSQGLLERKQKPCETLSLYFAERLRDCPFRTIDLKHRKKVTGYLACLVGSCVDVRTGAPDNKYDSYVAGRVVLWSSGVCLFWFVKPE